MSSTAAANSTTHGASERRGVVSTVSSLAELVGAHPDALRMIYEAGRPADPAELGDTPRGRLLALEKSAELFLLTRPLVRFFSMSAMPWSGKVFDHGGNAGANVVLGKQMARFRAEAGTSVIDHKPTLVLSYDEPSHGNPWPLRACFDELRAISSGIAIGPAFLRGKGDPTLLLWFGLELS